MNEAIYKDEGTTDPSHSLEYRVRHAISNGMQFIGTAFENLSTSKPNLAHAMRMYAVGTGKMKTAFDILDQALRDASTDPLAGYSGIVENTYTADHQEITKWTDKFESEVESLGIFPQFEAECPRSLSRAIVVGSLWHRFSSFMPWFLCQASAMVSTNEKRHYVIQTAFEELGMRDAREIHPDMFWQVAKAAGVTDQDREKVLLAELPAKAIEFLRAKLMGYSSDEEVLGVLLGLEIPAEENIETVFKSLAHTDPLRDALNETKFFRLHRQIESEHVRLTISNFLRFCRTDDERARFIKGFHDGLIFWQLFWGSAKTMINDERAVGEKSHA
jgi:hypothetical protein